MKLLFALLAMLFVSFVLFSCNEKEEKVIFDTAFVDTLLRNEKDFYVNSRRHFKFNDSALYLNEHDSIIDATVFFESVYLKSYFPVKAKNANQFKLVKVKEWPSKNIYAWVSGDGFYAFKNEKIKGKHILGKPMKDIYDSILEPSQLDGKHVFVKFWFIKCGPCVAEMPELNKIVEENKNRKDIVFISFALDKKEELVDFLKTTTFSYRTISSYKVPEIDSLNITSFPTHLYVKGNIIQKVIKEKDIRKIIERL